MMLLDQIGRRARIGKPALSLLGVRQSAIMSCARFFDGASLRRTLHFRSHAPRRTTRSVRRGELPALEPLSLGTGGHGQRMLELASHALPSLRLIASHLHLPNRFRQSARTLVDVLCANSPERALRILWRHNIVMLAHKKPMNQ